MSEAQTYTVPREALPAALRELAEAIGDADALRLACTHGGARLKVPRVADENSPLRASLSAAGLERLVRFYGGDVIDVPKGDAYLRELRHEHVRQLRAQKLTVDEVSHQTGYSRRQVMNILGGHGMANVDRLTLDLFGDDADNEPASELPGAGGAHDPFGLAGRS